MSRPVMTVLADIGHLFLQKLGVPASMGCMADETVFTHRRMVIDIRPALVSVTAVAELLGVICLHHAFADAAMWSVTGGAAHLALDDGMM